MKAKSDGTDGRKDVARGSASKQAGTSDEEALAPVAPRPLTPEDRRNVDAIADAVEAWLADFENGKKLIGELALRDVFDQNPVDMVRSDRLGNPRLALLLERIEADGRVTARAFTVLLRVIGFDHVVRGRYWKRLTPSVKERLLPLVDPEEPASRESLARLNAAAEHAVAFDLDAQTAAVYVRELLRAEGRAPRRNARFQTFDGQLGRSEDLFGTQDGLSRLYVVCDALPRAQVTELERKLTRTAEAMLAAAKKLKGRGRRG